MSKYNRRNSCSRAIQ